MFCVATYMVVLLEKFDVLYNFVPEKLETHGLALALVGDGSKRDLSSQILGWPPVLPATCCKSVSTGFNLGLGYLKNLKKNKNEFNYLIRLGVSDHKNKYLRTKH
jgi:hypothetical protein